MLKEHYKVYEEKMKKSVEAVERDFGAVRAGRANASVLNRIQEMCIRDRASTSPLRGMVLTVTWTRTPWSWA